MPDISSTLASIEAATGCQQCEGPLGDSPSDDFCSERCSAAWNAGIKGTLAEFIIEWRHPYDGERQEPLCDRHTREVRDALHVLAIGHAGMNVPEPSPCCRCSPADPRRTR